MSARNPSLSLPADVLSLMRRTLQLVDLLYWMPTTPTKGSPGEEIMAGMSWQRSPARKMRSGPSVIVSRESGEEKEPGEDQDIMIPPGSLAMLGHRERRRWLADVDLESRDMQGIWVGADELYSEYDPALFEDAFTIDGVHLYSDKSSAGAWQQGISSDG